MPCLLRVKLGSDSQSASCPLSPCKRTPLVPPCRRMAMPFSPADGGQGSFADVPVGPVVVRSALKADIAAWTAIPGQRRELPAKTLTRQFARVSPGRRAALRGAHRGDRWSPDPGSDAYTPGAARAELRQVASEAPEPLSSRVTLRLSGLQVRRPMSRSFLPTILPSTGGRRARGVDASCRHPFLKALPPDPPRQLRRTDLPRQCRLRSHRTQ